MNHGTILSTSLRSGDRIIVEPSDGKPFEAIVLGCLGWGLVHGVMDWQMRRDDGNEFTYGLPVTAPVQVLS